MKNKNVFGVAALITLGIMFGAVLVSGFGFVRPGLADIKLGADKPPVEVNGDLNSFSQAFIEVAEKVTPSIVQINVVSTNSGGSRDFFNFPFGGESQREQQGSGSGIIIREDGYILTNNHVIENAKRIEVVLNDKRKIEAQIIGTDPLTDLGVIKINANNLQVAYLGNSDNAKVGQWVMAIGNPLSLSSTVTAGIISALNRGQLRLINDSYGVENFIQTDAAINPGNSGGALVNLQGEVIGVNTAIATRTGGYMGYGFAIPINLAASVAKDLISNGKVSRGYIGVQIREVDAALAKSLGMETPTGVIIEKVVEGGSAAAEDIKRGDVILRIDNLEVNQPNQLQSYVASKVAGSKVTLTLWREGKSIDRTVTLKPREEDATVKPVINDNSEKEKETTAETMRFESLGVTVKNMTSAELKSADVNHGVVITEVKPYSLSFDQGLSRGWIIVKADKKDVKSVNDFEKLVNSKKGQALLLEVTDGKGNFRFVGLEVPN